VSDVTRRLAPCRPALHSFLQCECRMLAESELTGSASTRTIVSNGFLTSMSIVLSPSQCSLSTYHSMIDRSIDHVAPTET
jgi:hypothetical protein